jgi:AraC-like DNA-binding protein
MNQVIFNAHDMVIGMTAFLCFFFSLVVVASKRFKPISAYLLAGFLVSQAFIALHEEILYGTQFRFVTLDFSPNFFFVGAGAFYIDGALLYFYIRSLIYSDFRFCKTDLWHLVPIAMYFIYMLNAFYLQDDIFKREVAQYFRYDLIQQYLPLDAMAKTLRFGYALCGLYLIGKYRDRLKEVYADIAAIDLSWLKLMVTSFLLIMFVELLLAAIKIMGLFYVVEIDLLIYLGLSSYYAKFMTINLLLFFSALNVSALKRIQQKPADLTVKVAPVNQEYIDRIEAYMSESKPYLKANITFESLSELLDVPPRELSATLNRHFKMNFYEFINNYRIEEAKLLLKSEAYKGATITEIFTEVGFNSKSVFYTFFRKAEGMTPSEYRKTLSI